MLRRILSGSALSIIAMMVNIVVAMWMMPFIIHALGDNDYGLWVVVASFVGYYGLLDFGMSSAVTRFISKAEGTNDTNEVNVILNTSSLFFAALGFAIFIISIIGASVVDDPVVSILWLTVGITCIFQFGLRGFYGVFFARIRQDIMSYTTLGKIALRTSLIYYFLSNGYGVVTLALITMATEILVYAIDMIILRRIAPDLELGKPYVQVSRMKEMLRYGAFSMVTQIADLLRLRALPLVVTYAVGLANVVFFAIAIRLMEIYFQVVEKAIHILSPVFSQYEGRGDTAQIERMFKITFRINLVISIMIGMMLIIFANPFISWWIGDAYVLASEITIALSVGFMLFTMNQTGKTVLFGISKHQRFAVVSMIESIVGSGLALIIGMIYGPLAIALCLAAVMVVFEMMVKPYIICKDIGISVTSYYRDMVEVVGKVVLPLVVIGTIIQYNMNEMGIIEIVSYASLIGIGMIPFMWWAMDAQTKDLLQRRILSKMFKRGEVHV